MPDILTEALKVVFGPPPKDSIVIGAIDIDIDGEQQTDDLPGGGGPAIQLHISKRGKSRRE